MDSQSSLTDLLGGNPSDTSILDVIKGHAKPSDAIIKGAMGDYIPSSPLMASISVAKGNDEQLRKAIERIPSDAYDVVIIDTPPALSTLQIMSINASDGIIIPTMADRTSYSQLQAFLMTVANAMQTHENLDVIGCIITRWNERIKVNAAYYEAIEQLMQSYDIEILGKIRECSAIREAQGTDADLFKQYKSSNAVKDYGAIVKKIEKWLIE